MKGSRSPDTSAEAEAVQIQIFRRMSPEKRLQYGIELTRLSRKLLGVGVKYRHPEYTDKMVRLAVIRLILRDELFREVYPDMIEVVP